MSLASFLKESVVEFKDRVEWPKWSELQSSTIVVTVSTILLAIFTFGVDELFSNAVRKAITAFSGFF